MTKTTAIEDVLKELEAIVNQMENIDIPLEESLKLYAKAEKLAEKALSVIEAHKGTFSVISDKIKKMEEEFNAG